MLAAESAEARLGILLAPVQRSSREIIRWTDRAGNDAVILMFPSKDPVDSPDLITLLPIRFSISLCE